MINDTVNKIVNDLSKVQQYISGLSENKEVSSIERDLALSKLRGIYEFILDYKPSGVSEKAPSVIITETPKSQPAPIMAEKPKEIDFVMEPIVEVKPTTLPEPKKTVEPAPIPETVTSPKVPTAELKSEKVEILAETFQKKSFLNEVLAQYSNTFDLSKKFQSQPIADISLAIGINEKFSFIKELFKNDASLYQQTIEKLNTTGSFNDAIKYLDEQFSWDFGSSVVQKLLELVHRRYL